MTLLANLLAIHIDIDPEITEIGPFLLTWHGFFTAVGIVAGVYLAARLSRVKGIPTDEIYNAAMPVVFGGIVGARALFVIENLDDFQSDPLEIFALTEGGISVLGALLGGSLAVWLYVIFAGLPWARVADIAVPAVIFGFSIGRIGDIINGEHIGSQSSLPWATVYEHPDSPAFLLPSHHPAVAYEMILGLLLTAGLLYMIYRMAWLRDGWVAVVGIALYCCIRIFEGFFRGMEVFGEHFGDEDVFLGLKVSQLVSILVLVGLIPIAYKLMTTDAPDYEVPERLVRQPSRAQRRRAERRAATRKTQS
ncbi:MAG TPA: prolipoprotein diacylglyceryl transferase [Dehalococcoidia bacterium]|nr:prolipoprotein diacylglyceryl transferase [Dehalococcoidia bacterium]